jgi:hypothetical protein
MNKKAQSGLMGLFGIMLIVSLFYSVSINMFVYGMDTTGELQYVNALQDLNEDYDVASVSNELQENIERQTGLPIVDVGALVFYSGNIIIDLLLNFLYAIPQMITALFNGLSLLFGGRIDAVIMAQLMLFQSAMITALYILGTIKLVLSIRSGRAI